MINADLETSVKARLGKISQAGKLAHAFLFAGSDRAEHRAAIEHLLRMDVCEGSPKPCGNCAPCKKVAHDRHPDFLAIRSEKSEITVDQIHAFTHWVRLSPHESPRKYAWIEDAQNLNASSSNALLKTLEEPPPFSVLFLSVDRPEQAMITIRSRLMLVRFGNSEGSSALDPANEPAWLKDLEATLRAPLAPRLSDLRDLSETVAKTRDDLVWFLHCAQGTLVDRMKAAPIASMRRLEKLYDRTLEMERLAYQRYGNASLHLDRFFTEWFHG